MSRPEQLSLYNIYVSGIAAVSGAISGAAQAVAGAPAENVRLLMERGAFNRETSVSGWREAWKEVFRGSARLNGANTTDARSLHEIREIRNWMHEVRDMAGRGKRNRTMH